MKTSLDDLSQGKTYYIRFAPNGTSDPATTSNVAGKEFASVAYSDTGKWLVTLKNSHLKLLEVRGHYIQATAPGPSPVQIYNVTEGTDAASSFYVALYLNGSLNSPAAATGCWISLAVVVEETSA